jgi:REP element-mobilizing transposase RayT
MYGMARPLRIEYPGALYHITSRGDRREAIYLDEEDRRRFVELLGEVCHRFRWRIHAYCLMTNHYHLVAETLEGNLSRGMRQLLETDWLLSQFGPDRRQAVRAYGQFVRDGVGAGSPWSEIRNQIFLGDERFVSRRRVEKRPEGFREIPKRQRQVLSKSLVQYQQEFPWRDEAMARAYLSGAYTMKEIGDFFGVHYMTVSRAVHKMLACET